MVLIKLKQLLDKFERLGFNDSEVIQGLIDYFDPLSPLFPMEL